MTETTPQPCTYHRKSITRPHPCTAPATHILHYHQVTKYLCAEAVQSVESSISRHIPCGHCRRPRWLHWDLYPLSTLHQTGDTR